MRSLLPILFVAASCGGSPDRYEFSIVQGLPSVITHQYTAWEQPDHMLISAEPWSDGGGLFTLEPGSFTAESVQVHPTFVPIVYESLRIGPHERVPMYRDTDRLLRYDASVHELVDLAPVPEFLGGGVRTAYLITPEGELIYVDGSLQVFDPDSDSWTVVLPAGSLQLSEYAHWDGRIIALSESGIGELTAEGFTELATCADDCDQLRWNALHQPENGDLWIQENWRWWSFDGSEIRSIGPFPNPGAELGQAEYISQVMTAGVLDNRVFSVNRDSYMSVYGTMLSWKPGERDHFEHDAYVVGQFVGSRDSGMLLVPYTNFDPMMVLHD